MFSGTIRPRILEVCTNIGFDLLYCVTYRLSSGPFFSVLFLMLYFSENALLSLLLSPKMFLLGFNDTPNLWVILCHLPGKERKEIVEIKERDREERTTEMKVKKQKK